MTGPLPSLKSVDCIRRTLSPYYYGVRIGGRMPDPVIRGAYGVLHRFARADGFVFAVDERGILVRPSYALRHVVVPWDEIASLDSEVEA